MNSAAYKCACAHAAFQTSQLTRKRVHSGLYDQASAVTLCLLPDGICTVRTADLCVAYRCVPAAVCLLHPPKVYTYPLTALHRFVSIVKFGP